ncbi:MAG: hypothetical protein ACOYOK_02590, partial [Pseudobdellovibrionaceae bacterium]
MDFNIDSIKTSRTPDWDAQVWLLAHQEPEKNKTPGFIFLSSILHGLMVVAVYFISQQALQKQETKIETLTFEILSSSDSLAQTSAAADTLPNLEATKSLPAVQKESTENTIKLPKTVFSKKSIGKTSLAKFTKTHQADKSVIQKKRTSPTATKSFSKPI